MTFDQAQTEHVIVSNLKFLTREYGIAEAMKTINVFLQELTPEDYAAKDINLAELNK